MLVNQYSLFFFISIPTPTEPNSQYSTDWSPNPDPTPKKATKSGPAQSPVPMKAQLARSAGRRGQRATLDPIEKSMGRDDYDEWNLDVKDNITFELSDDEEDSLQVRFDCTFIISSISSPHPENNCDDSVYTSKCSLYLKRLHVYSILKNCSGHYHINDVS